MRSKALHLTPLTNEEFIQFFTQLLKAIDTDPLPMPAVMLGAKASVAAHLEDISLLFKRDHASRLTQKLVQLDGRRDDFVVGLQDLCEGHCYNPDEALREQAALLDRRLEVYGPRIYKQNYQQETAIINALVRDFREDPDCAAAVAALGLRTWIDALDRTNKEFDALFLERAALEVDKDIPYTMIQKRDEMRVAYENLLNKLDGFYHTAEGAEPWGRMVKLVEILTQEYREIVSARKGRKEARKEKEGTAEA
ncbi:hypothetical protein EPD60_07630 [Flaviaesturariibacter flavus]|uniref:Uncharacterized protein n=1 Tax=Flaviaesturariibacter flavus TaxID=2502780 RepID=A0A4R1BAG0_9BACT|nr:DUF6261 family protein [Flaviaesturariibacter flavus]TCJ13945.1 hypothetical protein EPD60_07985 [Flaviaesturariibacter flavus]TCJ15747.1 hypothetical protein EPD60_07795 [Flaviaesturariibacter flavus]TCJ16199.1 hypothetical protein EPD60_07630 [Flaviaesturariibacter flavus]